jgi:outer membrane protein insertion porin family
LPDARPNRHLGRFLSRAGRWILWTVCGLAVVVSLFVLALPWSTRYLVDRIAVLLSDRYDIVFSAGRVEFALRSLSLTLHDVKLATGAMPESATVVARRVNLDLATAALRGDLAFDQIEIVDPTVSWIAGGRVPVSSVPHTTRTASRPVISVGRLHVVNLDATVSTPSSLRLMVQGLSASLLGDVQGRLIGEIHADRGIRLEADGIAGMLDRVTASATIGSERLFIRSLVAESSSGDLRLDGAVMFGESAGYDLKYFSTIDVSELRKWWDRSPPARGRVEFSGSIVGALTDPRLTFDVRARDFTLGGLSHARLDATGHASAESIVVDTCVLRSVEGVFNGRGRIALGDGDTQSRLAGEWSLPRLRTLASRLNLDPSRWPALPVSGTANLSWPGPTPAITTVAGDFHARLRRPGEGSLTIAGKDGRWSLQYSHTFAGETVAELRLATLLQGTEFRRSSLSGSVDVGSRDFPAFLRQLRESAISLPARVDIVRSGYVTTRGTVAGSIGAPVVDLLVSAGDVSAGAVDAIQVSAAVRADRTQIVLTPLAFDTDTAHLEMRGSIGFAHMESAGEFDLRIDGPGRLASIVPADWRPTGSIAAQGSWSGRLDRPRVSARLAGENLISNGFHFESLAGSFEVADEELRVHDLRLSQELGQLRVDGRYNFRERVLSTTVGGRGLRVALRRLWSSASDGPAVADADLENVSVDMRVEGSVLQPSGEISLAADAVRLSGRDAGAVVARAHGTHGQIRLALRVPRFGAEASGNVTLVSPRPWTADVTLNRADVVQALTLLGVNPETLAASTAALSASGRASGNLDTRSLSTMTMEVETLDGQLRGQPLSLVQPARLRLDEGRVAIEPVQLRLGGLSVRAAGSWGAAPGTPAEGIAVNLDGRAEDLLNYLPPTSRDRPRVEGPLRVGLMVRRNGDLASISGEAFAQVTYLVEKGPARAGSRPPRAPSLSGEVRLALDLRATAFEPNAVDGTIVATTLAISAAQFPITQQTPTRLRLEKGRILIEQFDWTLPSGAVSASGTIGLDPANHGDMRVSGATSLGLVDVFLPVRGDGRAAFDIRVAGAINSLQYEGAIELTDARVILPEGRVSLAGWTGRLEVTGETIAAAALRGQVNGGDVSLNGTVTRRGAPQAAPLTISARNVFLEIPRGLRSELNADLTWRNQSGRAALSGSATITADPYTEPATAMVRIISELTRASGGTRRALPQWLGNTTLDVTLQSNGLLTLENSVGNVDMVPELRLTGTMSDAGLAGSIHIVDDGRIRVRGRSYRLRESEIVFTPEQGLVPRLNLFGETRIGDYEVTLRLSGPADAIETSLSSNPPLSDRDLQSLVVTGQTAGLMGETANTDAFAVGAVSGDVLGFAGQFVGLDSVRVGSSDDLELVSSDVEPSTRLTVSKRFGQRFELVLSENLDDSELTWVIIYRPRPGYEVRLSSSEGEENAVEFRQEITFGPGSSLRPAVVRAERMADVIAAITVSGDPGLSPSDVRDALELREGDRFDFREWSRDRERIQRLHYDRGYYAVHVTPTRKVGNVTSTRREVALDYRILRGPRTEIDVTGWPPETLVEILKSAWNDALVPELLAEDLESATRAHLSEEGYLRPGVGVTLDTSRPGVQRAVVQITPGSKTTIRQLTFQGNQAIATSELQKLTSERAQAPSVWNDPTPLTADIVAEYASRGYLAATAAAGEFVLEGDRATLPIIISEGPLARVETLLVDGVSAVRQQGAQAALGLEIGSSFAEGAERAARVRLERYYRDSGYRDARVDATTRLEAQHGRVDLSFTVTEGPLYVVRGVRVEGVQSTSDTMVDRAVTIRSGEAAGQTEVAETERRLYGLGTFRAAAVRFESVPSTSSGKTVAVDAVVAVQEARRYLLRYGIALSSEYEAVLDENLQSVGVAADLRDRNFLGRGISLGLGTRIEKDLASIRGLFSMPRLASLPLRTNLSLTWRSETEASSTGTVYSDDEANLTLEQRWRPRGWLELAWGYSASGRAVAFELPEAPARPINFDGLFASMNVSAVMDRRNSMFDPTRGWFYSTSLQWGLQLLGSDFNYLRSMIRGSYYQPIGRVVLASNARWGRLQPRGGIPPLTVFDLFFKAGGTQTVRGYKQDELSAYDAFGVPLGGTRLIVFNEEIRFPIFRIVKGVLFADAGNTFAERADFSISNLEVGVGFGLRITTPLAPIRIDLGYPVPGGTGLGSPRWHLSIGQMF